MRIQAGAAGLLALSLLFVLPRPASAYPEISELPVDARALKRAQSDPCFKWFHEAFGIFHRYQAYAADAVVHHQGCGQIYSDYEREIRSLGQPKCSASAGSVAADPEYNGYLFSAQRSWNDVGHETWIICNEDPLSLAARQFFRFHLRLFHYKCGDASPLPLEPLTETQDRRCAPSPKPSAQLEDASGSAPSESGEAGQAVDGNAREISFPGRPSPNSSSRSIPRSH